MKNEPFAKMFDTPNGQILYAIDITDDDEPCIRVRGAYVDDVKPEAKLIYHGENDRDAAFGKISQEMADETAAKLAAAVAGLAPRP